MTTAEEQTKELAETLQSQLSLSKEMIVAPLPHAVPTLGTRSYQINGIPTHLWVQIFEDSLFFGVSQRPNGRVGNYVICESEVSPINPKQREWDISVLLGSRTDPLVPLFARQLGQTLLNKRGEGEIPSIVMGISLAPETKGPAKFQALIGLLVDLYEEALNQR